MIPLLAPCCLPCGRSGVKSSLNTSLPCTRVYHLRSALKRPVRANARNKVKLIVAAVLQASWGRQCVPNVTNGPPLNVVFLKNVSGVTPSEVGSQAVLVRGGNRQHDYVSTLAHFEPRGNNELGRM